MLKGQPTSSPLETIYEESGSFISSTIESQQSSQEKTTNGLISARSIPSVDIQRQRASVHQRKLPIEVRFRDGSKRFIHPSTTATMIINRRNLLNSSEENLPPTKHVTFNNRPIFHSKFNAKTFQSKPSTIVTIITIDDMKQAGITSTRSSSTSSLDSSSITHSPLDTLSISNLHSSDSGLGHSLGQEQEVMQPNLNSSSSHRSSNFSLQMTLPTDENEGELSSNSNLSSRILSQIAQSTISASIDNATRSAFHSFSKPVQFNQKPLANRPQAPSTINRQSFNPTQQPITSYSHLNQKPVQPIPTRISNQPTLSQQYPAIPKDRSSNPRSLVPMNPSRHPISINGSVNNPFNLSGVTHVPRHSGPTLSLNTSPVVSWLNVTSNSIYDIPRLSSKYWRIPLRITLPIVGARQNQKSVINHDVTLQKRLLSAGLSPETVALYESILDVAENGQKKLSPKIIDDYYSYKSFI